MRHRIPSDWLKKTVDEIKEQRINDEAKCLVLNIMLSQ